MKPFCLFFLSLLIAACTSPGGQEINTPRSRAEEYPPYIEATPSRLQSAEETWRLLLSEFRLPESRLDAHEVLFTPRSLPAGLAGQINLNPGKGTLSADEAKETLRRFIERHAAALSGDQRSTALSLKDLSLVRFSDEGNLFRATYRQMSFPWQIASPFGELIVVLSKNGMLLQLSSTFVAPLLLSSELPVKARVEAAKAATSLLGREFTYTGLAGQSLKYQVAQTGEITVKELVIYPKLEKDRLSLHLAWQIEVGRGTTWTIFVDAINGTELAVRQNFAS